MEEKKENLYFTKPFEEEFQEMKEKAIELSKEFFSDIHLKRKVKLINKMTNSKDSFMTILSLFDEYKQELLLSKLSVRTRAAALKRRFSILGEKNEI